MRRGARETREQRERSFGGPLFTTEAPRHRARLLTSSVLVVPSVLRFRGPLCSPPAELPPQRRGGAENPSGPSVVSVRSPQRHRGNREPGPLTSSVPLFFVLRFLGFPFVFTTAEFPPQRRGAESPSAHFSVVSRCVHHRGTEAQRARPLTSSGSAALCSFHSAVHQPSLRHRATELPAVAYHRRKGGFTGWYWVSIPLEPPHPLPPAGESRACSRRITRRERTQQPGCSPPSARSGPQCGHRRWGAASAWCGEQQRGTRPSAVHPHPGAGGESGQRAPRALHAAQHTSSNQRSPYGKRPP